MSALQHMTKNILVSIKKHLVFIWFTSLLLLSLHANSEQNLNGEADKSAIIINNVKIFDGKEVMEGERNILIYDGMIQKISETEIVTTTVLKEYTIKTINGDSKVLMPGLIDAHWHSFMADIQEREYYISNVGYLHTRAAVEATKTLMRGYTSVRDAAGPSFGLKRAIDDGLLPGPRIYPSGAIISQTSGHGDLRMYPETHKRFGGHMPMVEEYGISLTVDGESEVLAAVREQLRKGASQIKIAVGGGASSAYDPLSTIQFTVEEIEAAVKAASDWGTYVMAHVYTDDGVKRAIEAGVKSIEHGHLISKEVYELISQDDKVWLSTQPFISQSGDNAKKEKVTRKTVKFYDMIREDAMENGKGVAALAVAFGTDRLRGAAKQREFLGYLQYKPVDPTPSIKQQSIEPWFKPSEILTMATYNNGRLLKLSNKRDPYPQGHLGVIEEGSYADLLIMKENPLHYDVTKPDEKGVKLFEDPETNILLIMKDGKIYKNKL